MCVTPPPTGASRWDKTHSGLLQHCTEKYTAKVAEKYANKYTEKYSEQCTEKYIEKYTEKCTQKYTEKYTTLHGRFCTAKPCVRLSVGTL